MMLEMNPSLQGLYQTTATLCERVESLITQQNAVLHQRILIALAGVPGSGKSTICLSVLRALSDRGIKDVVVLPMDGFHYSQARLAQFDDPALAFRKRGAPFTFDVIAFLELIQTLHTIPVTAIGEQEVILLAPNFDHARQDPVPDAISISSQSRIIIIEGNYTLLNEKPWDNISALVHDRWFVDATASIIKDRLVQRHIEAGIETSVAAATERVEDNDIPNGRLIRSRLNRPDITVLNC